MCKQQTYTLIFVGGSSGSFVKIIMYYYLYLSGRYDALPTLTVDHITGNCHENTLPRHYHFLDNLPRDHKIIAIDFEKDDVPIIAKMAYYKVWHQRLKVNPGILQKNWEGRYQTNDDLKQALFIDKKYDILIDPQWGNQLASATIDFKIRFKDILFGDINGIISTYLNVKRSSEIDKFVLQYREINKQYL